jgi:hypothetical protein
MGSVVVAALCLALGIARDSSGATPSTTTPRLNVVVIVSDDERLDANRRMRNVQRLARRRRHAARDQGWSTVVTSRPCPIGTVTDTSVGSACRAAA